MKKENKKISLKPTKTTERFNQYFTLQRGVLYE